MVSQTSTFRGGDLFPLKFKPTDMNKTVNYKSMYGSYKTVNKEFNDEEHFSNWYKYMNGKGNKIITIIDG